MVLSLLFFHFIYLSSRGEAGDREESTRGHLEGQGGGSFGPQLQNMGQPVRDGVVIKFD